MLPPNDLITSTVLPPTRFCSFSFSSFIPALPYQIYDPLEGGYYHGTTRDTRYARRVAFLSLFDIAQQIVYPPRLPLYRFSLSRIPIKLSSNPLKPLQQPYIAINSSNLILAHLAFACNTSFS
jgi:hypothetical protein